MITVGIDPHKRLLVARAINQQGQPVDRWEGANHRPGWEACLAWLQAFGADLQVGVEGAGSYGAGLARFLATCPVPVYDINPRWTAQERRAARRLDKSDDDDALAIARITLRESPALPSVVAPADRPEELLAVLNAQREALLADATAARNRLHALLHGFDPDYQSYLPRLTTLAGVETLLAFQPRLTTVLERLQFEGILRQARHLRDFLFDVQALAEQIEALAEQHFRPLIRLEGFGALSVGQLMGTIGTRRFRSDAQFAAFAGASPLRASSAGGSRHRLNRGGNRRLNTILYRAALTQSRSYRPAADYIKRRMQEGRTYREAFRCLKRFIARRVFQELERLTGSGRLLVQA